MPASSKYLSWNELSPQLEISIASSSTTNRSNILNNLIYIIENEKLQPPADIDTISYHLLKTYNYYQDLLSRDLVTKALISLASCDPDYTIPIYSNFIHQIVDTEKTIAITSLLSLFEWCVQLSSNVRVSQELIICQALILEKILNYCSGSLTHTKKEAHKARIRHSCQTSFCSSLQEIAISSVDQEPQHAPIQLYVDSIISGSKLSFVAKLSIFGLLANASVESLPVVPSFHAKIMANKDKILQWFNKDLLNVKTLFIHDYNLFLFANHFLQNFCCHDDDAKSDLDALIPTLEKIGLRNSELAFSQLTPIIFANLAEEIDVLAILSSHKLLSALITNLKATKESTRLGSSSTLNTIIERYSSSSSIENYAKLTDEIFKSFKTLSASAVDHKILHTSALDKLTVLQNTEISTKVCDSLMPLAIKDQNEVSLTHELQALMSHVNLILSAPASAPASDAFKTKIESAIIQGLKDKKPHLKKCWYVTVADNISVEQTTFWEKILPTMIESVQDILQNPFISITNKSIESAYVTISICHQLQFDSKFLDKCLVNEEKPSILTGHRVFSKLVTEQELKWWQVALFAVIDKVSIDGNADSIVHAVLSKKLSPTLRQSGLQLLKDAITRSDETDKVEKLVMSIISSLTQYLKDVDSEATADLDLKAMPLLINTITQSPISTSLKLQTVANVIAICHFPASLFMIKGSWVGVAQRAQVDPGMVVEQFGEKLISEVLLPELLRLSRDNAMFIAICESLATMAFIDPGRVVPLLTESIESDISSDKISNIDDLKLQIWRQSADSTEPVVDVLNSNKKQQVEARNSKDYETRKWEESVRKDLAAKKKNASVKKLTKEEQQLVNDQLIKEKAIKLEITELHAKLLRSLTIVDKLCENASAPSVQIDNGQQRWFPLAVKVILDILKAPKIVELIGHYASQVYLSLSVLLNHRLDNIKLFLGVATLRTFKIDMGDDNLTEEPLLELISRVLFRVKFLSAQLPLDSLSLVYILPLLIQLLYKGKDAALQNAKKPNVKSEFVEEDPEEEHLLLAMELISTHAEAFQDESIPRHEILSVLLTLLALPAKAKLSKECFFSMCQNISINISLQDLQTIIQASINTDTFVRSTVLEALDSEFELSPYMSYSNEIWIAVHDNDATNAELAATIWEENEFKLDDTSASQLITYLGTADSGIRLSVAKALAATVLHLNHKFEDVLDELLALYTSKAKPPPPEIDEFGLVVKRAMTDYRDPWEIRSGVALALKFLAPLFKDDEESVKKLFTFLVANGEDAALGDKEPIVRQELQEAGVEIINSNAYRYIESLIPIFEEVLSAKDQGTKIQDQIRESVIIVYGALARHLEASDPRLERVVSQLIKTLDTPSEDVQYAVSECIAPLVTLFKDRVRDLLDDLFKKLFDSKSLAHRRGAAYGIAGIVKGAGLTALADFDVIRTLVDAAEDKKDAKRREGVSFVIECLSQSLGKFFEPYVIETLPIILKQLGDSSSEVREATDYATRVIMKNTTSFGVKKLIPLAIENLDDIAWRTKRGSVDLLGSMAYLDPTQLSASLSTIVPEIVAVLNDSHKEVRKSADAALKRFGDVIRNPEIQTLVPTLIKAIGDPTKYTDDALDALINTQFVHYIDGPSLALIIHVIHRGMHDRSATTRRKSCQIVGNMAILVDAKDLLTYLPELIAELESSMVDPVPATRATAARALGSLVEKLGEDQFPDLIPRLLDTLQDESKAGDRLGSAQALSEIISALGTSKLEEMLPLILANASSSRSYVSAGFMPLLLFLPVCFANRFSVYLDKVIPVILEGLAADEEVRETALKAARLIVKNYATRAVDLLLPELERGLSDLNYRIRLSSVELTGELLFQITGITGKLDASEDSQDVDVSNVGQTLLQVLGQETRDSILASLFVCRQDTSGLVRNATVDIWKALVANTPKTIKEILPTLTSIIIRRLASADETQRNIAAQTLGELVRRVGANALPSLLPTLEEELESTQDPDAKQGICIAVRELIDSSSTDTVKEYQDQFVGIVRDALVDSNENVREAAASAFDVLQESIGNAAIDEIIPQLLNMLGSSSTDSANALAALQDIMSTKSDIIFPILIPTLISAPLDAFKARALASLAQVAGSALYKRLSVIINAFVDRLLVLSTGDEASSNGHEIDEIKSSFDDVLLSVDSDEGLHPLLQQLLALVKHEDRARRAVIFERLAPFFKSTILDYTIYTQDIVTHCITTLDEDNNMAVVRSAFDALTELIKRQSKEMLEKLVKPARQALAMTGTSGQDLAGFTLPKGPNCVLPIFLHGLMYGNTEQRELSALAIADIVSKTPTANLKPFVTMIVGPLIRVIGERFSGDVKAAILFALDTLFGKIPQMLRPFVPQLQRTFVKSLSDANNETLRSRAAKALGTLIEYQARVDPLVNELVGGCKAASDLGVRTAMLKALLEVVNKAGDKMSEASKNSVMDLVEKEISNAADDKMAVAYARLVGCLSKILTHDEAGKVLKAKVLRGNAHDEDSNKFAILTLNAFLRDAPSHIFETELCEEIAIYIKSCCENPSPYISDNGVLAAAKFLLLQGMTKSPFSNEIEGEGVFEISAEIIRDLVETLALTMTSPKSSSLDTRRLTLVSVRTLARFQFEQVVKQNIDLLAPSVFSCVRDTIIPIKLAAEKAFLAIFQFVEDPQMTFFQNWVTTDLEGKTAVTSVAGATIQTRSITDYSKRVAVRLANVERERIAAGGDEETMFSDRFEDENEVWAVGGVDLNTEK